MSTLINTTNIDTSQVKPGSVKQDLTAGIHLMKVAKFSLVKARDMETRELLEDGTFDVNMFLVPEDPSLKGVGYSVGYSGTKSVVDGASGETVEVGRAYKFIQFLLTCGYVVDESSNLEASAEADEVLASDWKGVETSFILNGSDITESLKEVSLKVQIELGKKKNTPYVKSIAAA